jgi:hypothetical protein
MTTTRTPIRRTSRAAQITPKAIEAFRMMRRLETKCICEPIDWVTPDAYWKHEECVFCERWWDQYSILHDELKAEIWDWPCIQTPGAVTPYPEGSYAAEHWKPNLEGQARYRMLERAAAEAAKDARARRAANARVAPCP